MLINKADYLSPELVAHWNQYFNERGIKHVFFSAKREQDRIDAAHKPIIKAAETSSDEDNSDAEGDDESDEQEEQ